MSKLKKKRQELLRYCAIECPDFKSYLLSKSKKVYKFSTPKRFLTINNEIKVKYIAKLENLNESRFFLSEKIQIDLKKLPYRNRRQEQRKELYKIYDEEMIKTSLKLFN